MKYLKTLFALVALSLFTGCGTLQPSGSYKGDKILYTADQSITGAYDTFQAFVAWELANRSALAQWPEITQAADLVRANAEQWINSAIAMREAYKANPSETNADNLKKALAILRAGLSQAAVYLKEAN